MWSLFAKKIGMSNAIMSLFCFASITPVAKIAYDTGVGILASSRKMYVRWVLQLAHIVALIVLSLFSFRKIILSIALFLSSLVISLMSIGWKNWSCSCHISLCTEAMTFSPNLFMPYFKLYVCRKLQAYNLFIPDKAVFMLNMVIKMIWADSELYSSIFSALACKYYHLCGGNLTLLVWCLPWFSSSSPSLSSASSEMSSSSSGS